MAARGTDDDGASSHKSTFAGPVKIVRKRDTIRKNTSRELRADTIDIAPLQAENSGAFQKPG